MMMIWQTHDCPYKMALLMFAADTPKNLQENNNLRVSVWCLLSKSIIDAKICLMQFRDLGANV